MTPDEESEYDLLCDLMERIAYLNVRFMDKHRLDCLTMSVGKTHVLVLQSDKRASPAMRGE